MEGGSVRSRARMVSTLLSSCSRLLCTVLCVCIVLHHALHTRGMFKTTPTARDFRFTSVKHQLAHALLRDSSLDRKFLMLCLGISTISRCRDTPAATARPRSRHRLSSSPAPRQHRPHHVPYASAAAYVSRARGARTRSSAPRGIPPPHRSYTSRADTSGWRSMRSRNAPRASC